MIDRLFDKICNLFGTLSSVAVLLIMLAIVLDVIGRAAFGAPLSGASEFAVSGLVAVVFLGLASAQRNGNNFRVEFVADNLPAPLRTVLELAWRLIVLAVLCWVAWLTTQEAIRSTSKFEASYGVVAFPIWPARILLSLGFWALTIQILLEIAAVLTGGPGAMTKPASGSDTPHNDKDT